MKTRHLKKSARTPISSIDFQPGDNGYAWRDLTVAELRRIDPDEAERVVTRISEGKEFPHRVLVV
jgi:hypothetical protein